MFRYNAYKGNPAFFGLHERKQCKNQCCSCCSHSVAYSSWLESSTVLITTWRVKKRGLVLLVEMSGAQALVEALRRKRVKYVFGMPGGANLPIYDALFDSDTRHLLVRHEQGARPDCSISVEVPGTPSEIDHFLHRFRSLHILELARTGITAVPKG
jgi:hypothetical protein